MLLHYSLPAKLVLDGTRAPVIFDMLQNAGVAKIWLHGYFYGHLDAPVEHLVEARNILQKYGFQTGVISIPVGHPGNSLDPDDHTLDLRIPSHWRYRVDRHGNQVHYCADIEENMVRDNLAAVMQFKAAGFTDMFLDDDLRMGNHGPETAGCFCDACIAEFNATYHLAETRESIGHAIECRERHDLIDAWTEYTCNKVTRLVKTLAIPGVNLGVMVMHRGDDRHGLRIPDWKPFVNHIRVGEAHFGDREFSPPRGKASEIAGMQLHIARMLPARMYSETTAFPARALSAANWACKAKLAVALGIPNIFLMGGTWLITQDYWQVIAGALPGLRAVESVAGDISCPRVAPVHVAIGRLGFELPWWPLQAGIPARPVEYNDPAGDGEMLLVLGNTRLDRHWLEKLPTYKHILFDGKAALLNENVMAGNPSARLLDRHPRVVTAIMNKVMPRRLEHALVTNLRHEIKNAGIEFPFFDRGMDIFLVWIKDKDIVVACNLRPDHNEGTLRSGVTTLNVRLQPLEMLAVKLGGAGMEIVARA